VSGNVTKEDIRHSDFVDAIEQASDGTTSIIFTGKTVVSTVSGTKLVTLSGVDLYRDPEVLENIDIIILAGTTAADGTYSVDAVQSPTTFTVNETIADSTGGTCEARNPSGARRTGFDPSGLTYLTKTNVQEALEEVDANLGGGAGGGITELQHEALDTLTHDLTETHNLVVTRSAGKVSQLLAEETGGTDIRKTEILTRNARGQVATYRVTQYQSDGTTIKRQLDVTVNRTGGRVSSLNVVRTT